MATLYSTALSILAPVVDNGVLPGDPRVAARLDEAQRRLIQQYNFVSHREESLETPLIWQAGGTNPGNSNSELILDDIDSTKLMILCAFREENNQLEMADAMEKKAFGYIERNVVNQVERSRYTQFSTLALTSQNTFGGLVGRLGLEIFSSYKIPYTRMQSYVNQAYQEAVDHYNFIVRNEQYDLSTLPWVPLSSDSDTFPTLLTAEIIRGLTLALLVQNNDSETQYTSGKEIQTFKEDSLKLIERNIAASVESSRKSTYETKALADQGTFGGLTGRVGLETMVQYKMPLARLQSFINQAYQEAIDHYNFVVRREELQSTALTYSVMTADSATFAPISTSVLKTLTLARITGDSGADSSGLRKQAFDFIERDVVATVETARRQATGTEGKLANELVDGVKIPTSRLTTYLTQAGTDATAHWNFLARREDYSSGTLPSPFDYEILKKLVESYVATSRSQDELASALKKEAFDLIERDLQAGVESARKTQFVTLAATDQNTFGGLVGRLGLETLAQYKVPYVRLQSFVNQAYQQAVDQFNSLVGDEQADLPQITFSALINDTDTFNSMMPVEILRLLVLALLAQNETAQESPLKAEAFTLLQRNVTQQVHSVRFATRKALAAGDPTTFGYHWARVGLDMPDGGLDLSDAQLKRIVNTAEEQLINSGKWVGTVDTYILPIYNSGEYFLPREVETILFAQFGSNPQPVFDRFNEWMSTGSGLRTDAQPWRYGFVDRGEGIDPSDGTLKRKYFISYPDGQGASLSDRTGGDSYAPY